MNLDDAKMVDCAGCGMEMLGESMRGRLVKYDDGAVVPHVRGRILGRPYCWQCLDGRRPPQRSATADSRDPGTGPWYENSVRAMEGDR